MKNLTILMAVVLMAVSSYANAAPELKIGVVDLQQIVQQTPDAKKVNEVMRKQFDPRQKKIVEAKNTLKTDMEKLQRDEAIMSAKGKSQLEDKVVKQQRALQRMEQEFQQDITVAQRRETEKFFAKVKKVVDKIAKDENYDLVLQKQGVPFASKRVELTKRVIDALS